MNEPTLAEMGGAPKGYTAASYGRDLVIFRPFLRRTDAGIVLLGPGSVGEGGMMRLSIPSTLKTEDLMTAAGPVFDAFSYHSYGAASQRCASMGQGALTSADAALSPEWLGQTLKIDAFYRAIRERFEPSKPVWITETADATCGGNPWASTFLDSFRYLHQLGAMARAGVQVVIHNTLASSDYGLLDEHTYAPRPNYWAALLWRKFMGATVLDAGPTPSPYLYLYAHCLRSVRGGVALLVINADRTSSQSLELPVAADRYTLTAPQGAPNLRAIVSSSMGTRYT
jgi:heparanase